jgi:hypothetical protein
MVHILVNHINNTSYHYFLEHPTAHHETAVKISVQPNFNNTSISDPYIFFLNKKTADRSCKLIEASQALLIKMEMVRIGDVLDIQKSDWHIF